MHSTGSCHAKAFLPSLTPRVGAGPLGAPVGRRRSNLRAATLEAPVKDTGSATTYPSEAARKSAFGTDLPPQQEAAFELEVTGTVPKWLKGSIVRNGSGFYAPEALHMFDGFGMLVKFTFDDGKVTTQQRCIDSTAYKEFVRTKKLAFSEFGTPLPPVKSIWNTMKGVLNLDQGFTDNAAVNTHPSLDNKTLVAMTEALPGTYRINLEDLSTLSQVKFGEDGVAGELTSAHPLMYPDGSMYNLYTDLGKSRCVAKVDPKTQQRTKLAEIPMDDATAPSWVHDLPGTENYIIVPDTPVLYDMKALLFGRGEYVVFKWDPSAQRTKFHIISRRSGSVQTVEAPFDYMTFHYANAFESPEGDELYLDTTAFQDPSMVNLCKLDNLRNLRKPVNTGPLSRITIPLDGRMVSVQTLVQEDEYAFAELHRINPEYKFRDYRFIYALSAKRPTCYGNALAKFDIKAGEFRQWHEPGCIPTEALMIPRPGATDEDDGVVTSLVTGADGLSFLLVLDASTFGEIARAKLPYGVAYGFHNQFYAASDTGSNDSSPA